jgi:ATP/maltotriose-dependent transcriptional regulator MalT
MTEATFITSERFTYSDPRLAREATSQSLVCPEKRLTSHEQAVLNFLLQDMSTAEISERLAVNNLTSRVHIANVLSKLEVSTPSEAVQRAREFRHSRHSTS